MLLPIQLVQVLLVILVPQELLEILQVDLQKLFLAATQALLALVVLLVMAL